MKEFDIKHVSVRLNKEQSSIKGNEQMSSSEDLYRLMADFMSEFDREIVVILNADNKHRVINYCIASIGTIDGSIANPREIFKAAILSNAAKIFMLHNHPSGDITPSRLDDAITEKIAAAGNLLGIPLVDHMVIGDGCYYSYAENTELLNRVKNYNTKEAYDKAVERG